MTDAAFSSGVSAALDCFTVPALPQGFADRLIERAQLRADIAALPTTRRAGTSPWKRSGRVVASVAAISLFTVAAAAGGIFGKPLYVPGITEVMQHANIIERKPHVIAQHHVAKPKAIVAPSPAMAEPIDGKTRAKAAIAELRGDSQFRKLPPKQRVRAMLRETRSMVKSGEITPQEGRAALRETAKESYDKLTPEQQQLVRQQWKKAKQRREIRRELRQERLQAARDGTAAQENPQP